MTQAIFVIVLNISSLGDITDVPDGEGRALPSQG